jgi:hypothetical protein
VLLPGFGGARRLPESAAGLDLGGEKASLQEVIDYGQRTLVRLIVSCTLPALGVGSRADAAPSSLIRFVEA